MKEEKVNRSLNSDITPTNLFQSLPVENNNNNNIGVNIPLQANASSSNNEKESIFYQDGRKYKVVKVENNKKETLMRIDISKMCDEETKV
jgi:hypothetical protein